MRKAWNGDGNAKYLEHGSQRTLDVSLGWASLAWVDNVEDLVCYGKERGKGIFIRDHTMMMDIFVSSGFKPSAFVGAVGSS